MRRVVHGKNKFEIAIIPIFNTTNMLLSISTRTGNAIVNKGDGSAEINYITSKNNDYTISNNTLSFSYSSAFTGNILVKLLKGLKDVYSIKLAHDVKPSSTEKYNISDIAAFLNQFPNLYSLMMDEYSTNAQNYSDIRGDLAGMPKSVERVFIRNNFLVNQTAFYLDFSSFTNENQLKYFKGSIRFVGDLAKIPASCSYFDAIDKGGSSVFYSGGKIWASVFNRFSLSIPLPSFENDSILSDMAASIVSVVGDKLVTLTGWRTPLSDAAVSSLQSKTLTVNVPRTNMPSIRYIKDSLNGNTVNGGNHWVEIKAYSESVSNNKALGKNAQIFMNGTFYANTSILTNGDISSNSYFGNGPGLSYAIIDLGELTRIDRIDIWHYYQDGRRFNNKVEVSADGVNWVTVFDSAISGTYAESSSGKTHYL